ncbi:unnamed protein product [Aphanomyces euteiches]|uniref:Glucokinase n=1 Tax=Aphanomyces euteiches TaxID=100861 RepID=A0A6G0XWY6_9STRA|nr:hypothetical protein Ae201684_000282 [Aphanomyces euteiches]KAH9091815.1 hypothetical protein Ae201684P_011358 [Aphanomyces euteiches]KAH9151096.1 hypothetical protein AeRB84_006219 [Aphanomyces euteiches]
MASDNQDYDLIVSGDCGGTNTRLTLWRVPHNSVHLKGKIAPGQVVYNKKFLNESHSSFVEVCHLFLKEAGVDEPPVCCVLACAGPVLNNSVVFTNIAFGWSINGENLQRELGIETVKLINDFVAMGYGLLTLREHEYLVLNDVPREEGAPIATVGAGTGLGECFLTPSGDTYECYPTEGGHGDYAPTTDIEVEIYDKLRNKFGPDKRLSTERMVSGNGLASIYEHLAEKFPEKVNKEIHTEFLGSESLRGAVVGKNASHDELCGQAMEIFVKGYGREAGNAALKYLPRGGFYITGGMAPKNLDFFTKKPWFLDALFDKGRVSPALKTVPIYLVLTEDLGERGAHYYSYQLLSKSRGHAPSVAAPVSQVVSPPSSLKKHSASSFSPYAEAIKYFAVAASALAGVIVGFRLAKSG